MMMTTLAPEIEAEAAQIRASWSEGERLARASCDVRRTIAGTTALLDDETQHAQQRRVLRACYEARAFTRKPVKATPEARAIERSVRKSCKRQGFNEQGAT